MVRGSCLRNPTGGSTFHAGDLNPGLPHKRGKSYHYTIQLILEFYMQLLFFCNVNSVFFLFITWRLHATVVLCNVQMFLINEYVEVYRIYCFVYVSYCDIELGIENRGISLVFVSTTKCLVS